MKKLLVIVMISVFGIITFASACDNPPCVQVEEEPELNIETYAMSDRNFDPSCDTLKTDKIGIHDIGINGKGTENFDVEAEVQIYTLDNQEGKYFNINGADITVTGLDEQLTYVKVGTNDECKVVELEVKNNRDSDSEIKVGYDKLETTTSSHQDVKVDYKGPENKLEFDIFNQTIYTHNVQKDGVENQVYYRGLIKGSKATCP